MPKRISNPKQMNSDGDRHHPNQQTAPSRRKPPGKGMVWIEGGTFLMGSDHHYPEEAPAHNVTVSGFWIDQFTVTNKQFQRFVKETGYVTFAERPPKPENYPGALPELLVPGSSSAQNKLLPVTLPLYARLSPQDVLQITGIWRYYCQSPYSFPLKALIPLRF